jgi:hypothetical protein
MRKLIIVGMMVGTMAFSLTGCGGGSDRRVTSSAAVPNDVLDEFYDMYPAAEGVDWRLRDGLYEADFEVGDNDMKATFTPDGDYVRGS